MNGFSFLNFDTATPQIIYAFDPLCGWCYGFSPAIEKVRQTLGEQVPFRLACGGLITGDREQPIREVAGYLRQGMEAVERQTEVKFGRAFVEGLLAKGTWISRSEPPCRAVLLVQEMFPDRAVDFAHALSKAFYYYGLAPDAPETIAQVARDNQIDVDLLLSRWHQPETQQHTQEAFESARSLGIQSYPRLFLWRDNSLFPIVNGCVNAEKILEELKLLLPEIKFNF